jgi:hypothetical protein
MEQRLQFVYRLAQLLKSTKALGDFRHVAVIGYGLDWCGKG